VVGARESGYAEAVPAGPGSTSQAATVANAEFGEEVGDVDVDGSLPDTGRTGTGFLRK
jgi:hypothetical protein